MNFAHDWILGSAPATKRVAHQAGWVPGVLDATFRGVGQVVFMDSPISGLLITIGLVQADAYAGFTALLGCFIGTLAGTWLEPAGHSSSRVKDGLYGFNGNLVGVALAVFAKHDHAGGWGAVTPLLACVVLSAFSSVVCVALGRLLSTWKVRRA